MCPSRLSTLRARRSERVRLSTSPCFKKFCLRRLSTFQTGAESKERLSTLQGLSCLKGVKGRKGKKRREGKLCPYAQNLKPKDLARCSHTAFCAGPRCTEKAVIISAALSVASRWFLGLIRSSAFLVPHHCSSSARVLFPAVILLPPLVVGLVVLVPVDHVFDGLEEIALPRSLGRPRLHS